MSYPNLILNNANYNQSSLTNNKYYAVGAFGCNYPVFIDPTISLTTTIGLKEITADQGLLNMLGCDIQNNNKPLYPFIISSEGHIFEVAAVLSDTVAVLVSPSLFNSALVESFIINSWGGPVISDTIVQNTSNAAVTAALLNSTIGEVASDLSVGQTISLGAAPIAVDLQTTGIKCQITVIYQS